MNKKKVPYNTQVQLAIMAVNALESMLGPNGKALADTIYSRTDSIVVDASEFKRQAKGGDGNG